MKELKFPFWEFPNKNFCRRKNDKYFIFYHDKIVWIINPETKRIINYYFTGNKPPDDIKYSNGLIYEKNENYIKIYTIDYIGVLLLFEIYSENQYLYFKDFEQKIECLGYFNSDKIKSFYIDNYDLYFIIKCDLCHLSLQNLTFEKFDFLFKIKTYHIGDDMYIEAVKDNRVYVRIKDRNYSYENKVFKLLDDVIQVIKFGEEIASVKSMEYQLEWDTVFKKTTARAFNDRTKFLAIEKNYHLEKEKNEILFHNHITGKLTSLLKTDKLLNYFYSKPFLVQVSYSDEYYSFNFYQFKDKKFIGNSGFKITRRNAFKCYGFYFERTHEKRIFDIKKEDFFSIKDSSKIKFLNNKNILDDNKNYLYWERGLEDLTIKNIPIFYRYFDNNGLHDKKRDIIKSLDNLIDIKDILYIYKNTDENSDIRLFLVNYYFDNKEKLNFYIGDDKIKNDSDFKELSKKPKQWMTSSIPQEIFLYDHYLELLKKYQMKKSNEKKINYDENTSKIIDTRQHYYIYGTLKKNSNLSKIKLTKENEHINGNNYQDDIYFTWFYKNFKNKMYLK
jgi:hypothetical protein